MMSNSPLNNAPDAENELPVSSGEIIYLSDENAVFSATSGGFAALDFDGRHYDRIAAVRAFPFTDPGIFISIRECDERGREIGIIRDMSLLSEQTAALISHQLSLRYFTPKIKSVKSIKAKYGYAYFDTETDCGHIKFTIRMGGEGVARLSETHIIFYDIDGNRFEIEDLTRFSTSELKKLDVYI